MQQDTLHLVVVALVRGQGVGFRVMEPLSCNLRRAAALMAVPHHVRFYVLEAACIAVPWICRACERTKIMNRLQFIVPVRIRVDPNLPVEEIYDVDQAIEFLHNWPTGRQGPIYQTALNCCHGVKAGEISTENAQKSLIGFARITGILAKDMSGGVVAINPDGELAPLAK